MSDSGIGGPGVHPGILTSAQRKCKMLHFAGVPCGTQGKNLEGSDEVGQHKFGKMQARRARGIVETL